MINSVLADNFFRHEYSRLVSSLSRQVGFTHLERIEDAVQSALLSGLETWTEQGLPENPSAWVYKTARNKLISTLRQRTNQQRLLQEQANDLISQLENNDHKSTEEQLLHQSDSDLLRLLFVCCHPNIPQDSQLVFALKSLCGFSIAEISQRLFNSEANVYKRYTRAKGFLKKIPQDQWSLDSSELSIRLPGIHKVLYLIFTEGYLSVNNKFEIRKELCDESIRLASLLVQDKKMAQPESYALLALMNLHVARMGGRLNEAGGLLLLEEQDRSSWNGHRIEVGLKWLELSASGKTFSRYHAEAGVAAEHCLAPSYNDTNWERIADCYRLLEQQSPSAIHRLNRAVVIAEWKGAEAGLSILEGFEPPTWLSGSYLWFAVLADLHKRCGNQKMANEYKANAINLAPTKAMKDLLKRRHKKR